MKHGFRFAPIAQLALVIVLILAAACSEEEDWKPCGELRIIAIDEELDGDGVKRALLTYKVRNTGLSSIVLARAATRVVTGRETYYLQIDWSGNVPAGKSIYASVGLPYRTTEEGAALDDVFIDSVFFQ